jgi:hypothetical protein
VGVKARLHENEQRFNEMVELRKKMKAAITLAVPLTAYSIIVGEMTMVLVVQTERSRT